MTRDEILNMPAGREMDALIWMVLHNQEPNIFMCRFVDGDYQPHAGYPSGHISPAHYSTDISAAWQVVEKMSLISDEHFIDLHIFPLDFADCGGGIYAASFNAGQSDYVDEYEDGDWIEVDDGEFGITHGETPALAICRAALLAVMEKFP